MLDIPVLADYVPPPSPEAAALLRNISYQIEKLLKRSHGKIYSVLWLVSYTGGRRQLIETKCTAPSAIPDQDCLAALVDEMRESLTGATCFAVGYAANLTTVSRPVEKTFLMRPAKFTVPIIMLEMHSATEYWRAQREWVNGRLAAMAAPESASNSIYAGLLPCAE